MRIYIYSILLFFLSSCSLMNFENSQVPLPKRDLNIRVFTHDFGTDAIEEISRTSDSILSVTHDTEIQMNALMLKINFSVGIRKVSYQLDPMLAFEDTWIFLKQFDAYVNSDKGHDLFDYVTPLIIESSMKLNNDFNTFAKNVLRHEEFNHYQKFAEDFASRHPFNEFSFKRPNIKREWYDYRGIPDTLALNTVGSLSEVMADFSDRVDLAANQIPKQAKWHAQLYSKMSGVDSVMIHNTIDSINSKVARFVQIAEQSPEMLDSAATKLRIELTPFMEQLNYQWGYSLDRVSEERVALDSIIARERANIMADVDSISVHVVDKSLEHVRKLISEILFYLIILFAIILFIPFSLGYLTGRTLTRNKILKKWKDEIDGKIDKKS